jgi:two-component system LytT family response regulator
MCVHADGKVHILRSTMKDLESKLSPDFVRIHRSTIVNLRQVKAVDTLPKGECLLHLDEEVTVRVSRNYRAAIQHLLS